MDRIFSIAQLEGKLELYKDGLITDTEMRAYCDMVGQAPPAREPRIPSEKTRLKHEARRLRREVVRLKALKRGHEKNDALAREIRRLHEELSLLK